MGVWAEALLSVGLVSAVPLLGLAAAARREESVARAVPYLVAFAAGALVGGATLHLVPEAGERLSFGPALGGYFLAGFLGMFLLERAFWFHRHGPAAGPGPRRRALVALVILADGIHNFVDGMVVAASFAATTELGVATTAAVVAHELPQEIGDFGILVHGGLGPRRAVLVNFLSGLTAFAGAVLALLITERVEIFAAVLLPIAAGSFLYIAGSDLLPELQTERDLRRTLGQLALLLAAVGLMALAAGVEAR